MGDLMLMKYMLNSYLLIFICCYCLIDEAQNPPAVKRVCNAARSTTMQIDHKEEESKFQGN